MNGIASFYILVLGLGYNTDYILFCIHKENTMN